MYACMFAPISLYACYFARMQVCLCTHISGSFTCISTRKFACDLTSSLRWLVSEDDGCFGECDHACVRTHARSCVFFARRSLLWHSSVGALIWSRERKHNASTFYRDSYVYVYLAAPGPYYRSNNSNTHGRKGCGVNLRMREKSAFLTTQTAIRCVWCHNVTSTSHVMSSLITTLFGYVVTMWN